MNLSKTKKYSILTILVLCFFAVLTHAQTVNQKCFEVKYLDFFGLDKIEKINWSDKEINELLRMNYYEKFNGTRFFIPPLVSQLKDFHPDCNNSPDLNRFDKLVSLYFKVRLKDISPVENKSIADQLNFIRADFYDLVQDEKLLPMMRYTMDDGPLYGEISNRQPKLKNLENIVSNFGKLTIAESDGKILIIATDKKSQTIWSRVMKGTNPERYLRNLEFDKEPIEETSLATIIHFYSEGERLNLFLKPDGNFMYYYHSW